MKAYIYFLLRLCASVFVHAALSHKNTFSRLCRTKIHLYGSAAKTVKKCILLQFCFFCIFTVFWQISDRRYYIKTINANEANFFMQILPKYTEVDFPAEFLVWISKYWSKNSTWDRILTVWSVDFTVYFRSS